MQNIYTRLFSPRTLSSESFGAGFGSALATIDANGDGRDDLLVNKAPIKEPWGMMTFLRVKSIT